MMLKSILIILGALFFHPARALALEGTIDTGDTAWVIMSTALVMMMTPAGLAAIKLPGRVLALGRAVNKTFTNIILF